MYAIVDIETTGGHASAHGITEIAIFLHDGKQVTGKFESLVNPGKTIPQHITALTGISNAMVADAPYFEDIAEKIHGLLQDRIFIAHNVNFDHSFVRHQLESNGFAFRVKKLCTVRLARKIFPGQPSYSLGNLCRSLEINLRNRHRAGGDAAATVMLFDRMLQAGGEDHITQMLKRNSAEHWLPVRLERKVIDALPVSPGVYYFHDEKGKVIYVGKAVNIRKRVTGHFTHTDTNGRRQHFLRLVTNVSHAPCANELHALVLESTEIRRLWPRYNYSQKKPAQRFGLYSYEDHKGYIRLLIDKKKKNVPALYEFNLLHEGLVMIRKMADAFELHDKLCFIDKTPITAEEAAILPPVDIYNDRVKAAMKALAEKLQTFAVIDDAPDPSQKLCMLVERGNFWGMGYIPAGDTPGQLEKIKEILEPYPDNDFIRNSIYSFADAHPYKRVNFS